MVKNQPACRRPRFSTWVRKISWRREQLHTSVFLPGEFHGQRSLVGYSPWDCTESDTSELLTHTHTHTHTHNHKQNSLPCPLILKKTVNWLMGLKFPLARRIEGSSLQSFRQQTYCLFPWNAKQYWEQKIKVLFANSVRVPLSRAQCLLTRKRTDGWMAPSPAPALARKPRMAATRKLGPARAMNNMPFTFLGSSAIYTLKQKITDWNDNHQTVTK